MRSRPLSLAVFALVSCLSASCALAEDWPQWRGPRGDGSWQAPKIPERFPEGGPKVVWKAPVAAGYSGLDGDGWVGALVPAGTPKDIVDQLNGEIVRIVGAPDLKERLATLGLDPVGSTPEAFAQQLRAEEEKWAKVIRAGNIKAPQ